MSQKRKKLDIECKQFKPLHYKVILRVDKDKKQVRNGLWFDTSFNPLSEENSVQDGEVVYLDERIKDIKVGDRVFCHHFLTNEDRELYINGELFYVSEYEDVYFVKNGDDIKMLHTNNLLDIIYEDESNYKSDSGIYLKPTLDKVAHDGVIRLSNPYLMDEDGVGVGDRVRIKQKRPYKIDVDGELMYMVRNDQIEWKYLDEKVN